VELRWSGAHLRQNRARTAAHSARERQKSWKVSDRGIGYRMAHRNLPGRHRHCTISPRRMVATGLPSTGRAEKEAALEAANLTDDLAACTVRCDRISLQRASMRWKITFNSLWNLGNVG